MAVNSAVQCTVETAVLYTAPSSDSARVAVIHDGRPGHIVARTSDWARIRLATGTEGWVHVTQIAPTDAPPLAAAPERDRFLRGVPVRPSVRTGQDGVDDASSQPAAASTRAETIVRTALSYRGTPYRRGATGRGGFDCSGFTSYLFAKAGSPLPRTAADQFKRGTDIPRDQIQPGDLVFFRNTYKRGISHVGIYIGENNFVHAASTGRGVRVDSLSGAYYANRWAGARRP